jgi:hypothetical protein
MSKFEELTAASLLADAEMERQNGILQRLRRELEETGTALSCAEYGNLQSSLAQQEQRAEQAARIAAERRAAVDVAREVATVKVQREQAEAAVDTTLNRLRETQAAISAKRTEAQRIAEELPQLTHKASQLLHELAVRKEAALRLGA